MYKTFEELKKELGDSYDKVMYDMNLELIEQKKRAITYIKLYQKWYEGIKLDEFHILASPRKLLEILGDED